MRRAFRESTGSPIIRVGGRDEATSGSVSRLAVATLAIRLGGDRILQARGLDWPSSSRRRRSRSGRGLLLLRPIPTREARLEAAVLHRAAGDPARHGERSLVSLRFPQPPARRRDALPRCSYGPTGSPSWPAPCRNPTARNSLAKIGGCKEMESALADRETSGRRSSGRLSSAIARTVAESLELEGRLLARRRSGAGGPPSTSWASASCTIPTSRGTTWRT
jgi:hypothetical protein